MRIVFIGSTKFGMRCMHEALELIDCELVGVVTAPQTFAISYRPEGVFNVLHADIASYCRLNNIPYSVMQHSMNDERLIGLVRSWQPEIFLVAGWYHMVPKSWRTLAPAYGLHASLLPDYSGGAPLIWAIINGEERTGLTLFQLGDGVDDGPIVGQAETQISYDDTIGTLYSRIEEMGIELINKHLPQIARGSAKLIPQDESKRRVFPQRGPCDGRIDWSLRAHQIYNFIRAQTKPYPGAFTTWQGKELSIWRARPKDRLPGASFASGEILPDIDGTFVNTGLGTIEILEATYDGQIFNGKELRQNCREGEIFGI